MTYEFLDSTGAEILAEDRYPVLEVDDTKAVGGLWEDGKQKGVVFVIQRPSEAKRELALIKLISETNFKGTPSSSTTSLATYTNRLPHLGCGIGSRVSV